MRESVAEQLSLPGIEPARPRRRPTDNLFYAIKPDLTAAANIEPLISQLRLEHGLKGKSLTKERFHVSLHHVGSHAGLPQEIVAAAIAAGASVTVPPLELMFDRVMSFRKSGKQPLVLRACYDDALEEFWRVLGVAMQRAGVGRWMTSHYTPHLTLLYDSLSVKEQTIEPIRWTAHEFVLMHSLLGRNRHVPLAKWVLCG